MYQTSIEGIHSVMKECWNIYESTDNNFQKLAALKLAKECHEAVFGLVDEGPSIMYLKQLQEKLIQIESRYAKDLFKKLDNYNFSNSNGNEYDDYYYLEIGSEPQGLQIIEQHGPRLLMPLQTRHLKTFGTVSAQDASRRQVSAQEEAWYFHESSWYMRGIKSGFDGQGCCDGICVPECRFYPEYERIEDEEVLKWCENK